MKTGNIDTAYQFVTGITAYGKKVSLSVNAIVAGMILIAACAGVIVYQNSLHAELFQKYIDIKHKNNDTGANLVYVMKKLEKCETDTSATTAAGAG